MLKLDKIKKYELFVGKSKLGGQYLYCNDYTIAYRKVILLAYNGIAVQKNNNTLYKSTFVPDIYI